MWRLQGYTAYGFDDDKFKYGFVWKVDGQIRNEELYLRQNRRIEQIGALNDY
jgi:hypothetical protein